MSVSALVQFFHFLEGFIPDGAKLSHKTMTEEIKAILESDVIISRKRGVFSTPTEITNHLNRRLDSAYSSKFIAECLKSLGWQVSGKKRVKRNKRACNFYHLAGDIESKALLSPKAHTKSKSSEASSEDGESLSSIDKRFKKARASKEQNLSDIRLIEVTTSKVRRDHLEIQLARERKEVISLADVRRGWAEAVNNLKVNLFLLPNALASRFASLEDEDQIHDDLKLELEKICHRLADAENDTVSPTEDELYKTTDAVPETGSEVV